MEPSISSDLIRGHIDTIILKSISESDKFAQQIIDYVEQKSNGSYEINQATLYSSLKRLEKSKLVSSYWHNADDGRRKFFSITEKGLESINENISNWSFSRAIIDSLMDTSNVNKSPIDLNNKNNERKIEDNNMEDNFDNKINEDSSEENVEDFSEVKQLDFNSILGLSSKDDYEKVPLIKNDSKNKDSKIVEEKFDNSYDNSFDDFHEKLDEIKEKNNTEKVQKINSLDNSVEEKIVEKVEPSQPKVVSNKDREINFRYILNGLISSTKKHDFVEEKIDQEYLEPIEKEVIDLEIENNVAKFNKTIKESDYSSQIENNTTKIDFSDLTLKAISEGYKLRISSKDSAKVKGNIYTNKLFFLSSILLLFVFALELVALSFFAKNLFSTTFTIISVLFCFIFPIISFIIFMNNPKKTTQNKNYINGIITSSIVVFNALIIIIAGNVLSNVDFSNKVSISKSFIIPILLSIDVLLFFVFKYLISKLNIVKIKPKKSTK